VAALRRELDGRATLVVAGVIGVLGAIAIAVGIALDPERAFASYLAAWCTVTTIAIGALAFLAIGYATNARWPAVVRRLAEAIAGGLLPVALLGIPLLVGADWVWPHSEHSYFARPFFIARTVVYFAGFVVIAELLRRWSLRRDTRPTLTLDRERALSSVALPIIGLGVTFAAFDWLMSLQPGWWSSGFGIYILTGTLASGLATIILLAWRGVANGMLPLTHSHFHALARLQHAFVILWAYIAYFQAMLIQIANKPNEAQFYVDRSSDGWRFVTALLVITAFALPFPLLFPRRLKRRPAYLGSIAVLILASHYLDMWWLVIPHASATPMPAWTDFAALAAIAGLVTAACTWRMRGAPLLPVGDPHLAEGLVYETNT
jgi:hypothetical protein